MMNQQSLEKFHPFLLIALVVLCYSNSLRCGLVYDDLAAIRDNRDIRPHTPFTNLFLNDFWGTPLKKEQSHKSYRPLTVLTFRLNYAVHGLSPFGYHLINIALHAVVTLLFNKLCLHFLARNSSLVASALFAVHPIHTEAVTGVVGRAELLSATAFLGALLFYIHNRYRRKINVWQLCSGTSLLAAVGVFCKEQSLTAFLLCCVVEVVAVGKNSGKGKSPRCLSPGKGATASWLRESLLRIALLVAAAAVTLGLRMQITGSELPTFSRFDNPASVAPTPTRQLTYNYLLSVNAWLLLFPWHLCCDWTMSTVPLVTSFWDARNLATAVLYFCVIWTIKTIFRLEKEVRRTVVMGLALLVVPFLPASNLFFPVGFVVAERVLYIPSMGFCMLIAYGCSILWDKRYSRLLLIAGFTFLLLLHAVKTIKRNTEWQSEYSLYSSALMVNQRNGKLYNNMGQVLESLSRPEAALQHYKEAIRIQPDDIRSYLNIARVLTSLGRYREAEEVYTQAKKFLPPPNLFYEYDKVYVSANHLQLFLNLAFLISKNESRLEEADALYRQVINLRSDFINAYLNRGDVLLKLNRTKEAEAMYLRAIEHDNTNPDLYFNLGVVLMDQGRNLEALNYFNKALIIDPDHEKSLVYSAILIQENGMSNYKDLAKDRLEKIVDQGKENERVYVNLGLLALENKDRRSAERWFKKVLSMKPTSRVAMFNLALLMSEQRPSEAYSMLQELVQYHPSHVNALILMADIRINHFKDLDTAEQHYREALRIEPNNVQAIHNLCVILVERQDLPLAEKCFVEAADLHPKVDYIQSHLKVVRDILEHGKLPDEQNNGGNPSLLSQFATSPSVS